MNRDNQDAHPVVVVAVCAMHGLWFEGCDFFSMLQWAQSQRPLSGFVHTFEEVVEEVEGIRTVCKNIRSVESDEIYSISALCDNDQFGKEVDELFAEALARIFGDFL